MNVSLKNLFEKWCISLLYKTAGRKLSVRYRVLYYDMSKNASKMYPKWQKFSALVKKLFLDKCLPFNCRILQFSKCASISLPQCSIIINYIHPSPCFAWLHFFAHFFYLSLYSILSGRNLPKRMKKVCEKKSMAKKIF